MSCPCGSGVGYDACCGALHSGVRAAPTAEALMRSRYAAFAVGDAAYLSATWDPATRPGELSLPDVRWTRLRLLDVVAGGADDATGVVEFRAHYRRDGEPGAQHERSRFRRDGRGRWVYVAPE